MSDREYKQAFVRLRSHSNGDWFASPELRPRLVADAAEKGISLTEVAVEILCKHFQVQFVPSGRRTNSKSDDTILNLRLPMQLYRVLAATYPKYQDGIRAVLSAHYGLRLPPKVRHTRQRPRAIA